MSKQYSICLVSFLSRRRDICQYLSVLFVVLHIKNKFRGRVLINSLNPSTWDDIKILLANYFGDSRDLSALQRMTQIQNESQLTFEARHPFYEAKMQKKLFLNQLNSCKEVAQNKSKAWHCSVKFWLERIGEVA